MDDEVENITKEEEGSSTTTTTEGAISISSNFLQWTSVRGIRTEHAS